MAGTRAAFCPVMALLHTLLGWHYTSPCNACRVGEAGGKW